MLDHLANIADVLVVVGPFSLWLYHTVRKLDNTVVLTKQIATKHLPFVYERLKEHDALLLLDSPLPPNIGIVNGSGK
jgi:hypothetical protein